MTALVNTETQNTVESLRAQGYKVLVQHYRPVGRKGKHKLQHYTRHTHVKPGVDINSHGGLTIVVVTPPDGGAPKIGFAVCSEEDNFCYRRGARDALKRAGF